MKEKEDFKNIEEISLWIYIKNIENDINTFLEETKNNQI